MKGIEACAWTCLTNEVGLSLMLLGWCIEHKIKRGGTVVLLLYFDEYLYSVLLGDVRSILWSTRLKGWNKAGIILFLLYLGEYLMYSVLTTEYWWEILGATCLCKSLSRCFNNLWKFCSVGAVFTDSIYLLYTSTAEKILYLRSLMHNPPSPWVLAHVAWIPLACILSRPISCSSAMGQKRSPAWNSSIMKGSWPLFLLRKVGTLYSFIIKMFTSTIRILEMLLLGDVKSCFCALYRS